MRADHLHGSGRRLEHVTFGRAWALLVPVAALQLAKCLMQRMNAAKPPVRTRCRAQ